MKPIKLTMRAFGPYKNEEVIDFTKLQDHRLFVISGSTGAGKTTIFDGICFALYGYGSGQDRKDTKMLRSDFADDQVHTAVELIFEIHGRQYRVLRQLPHVKEGRKSATGEKYEFFEILSDNQEVPVVERQKVTDINQKLEEIIGLTYDQFSQIVMLPQGEFRKLLTSQSDNKEEILRKIFKTNRYGEMTKKLEEKKRQAEEKLNEAKILKNTYIGQLSGVLPKRDDSYLFTLLEQNGNIFQIQDALQEEFVYYQQKVKDDQKKYQESFDQFQERQKLYVADKTFNERIEAHEKKIEKLQQLEQQKTYFENLKTQYDEAIRASQIKPLNDQCISLSQTKIKEQEKLQEVTRQFEATKDSLQKIYKEFILEEQKQTERDEAFKRVMNLQQLLPVYEKMNHQTILVQKLYKETEQASSSLQQVVKFLSTKKDEIEKIAFVIEQLEKEVEQLDEAKEQQIHLREIMNMYKQYHNLNGQVLNLKNECEFVTKQYQVAKEDYELEENRWINNQAAILATKLLPGSPCPVCGSTDHNVTHGEINDMIDEKELKRLKTIYSEAQQRKSTAEANLLAITNQLNQCLIDLNQLEATIEQQEELTNRFNEINELVQRLQVGKEKLVKNKNQLKQLQHDSNQLEQQRKNLEEHERQIKEQFLKENTVLEQQRNAIPEEFQHLSQLQQALATAESFKNQLQMAWEHVQKQYQHVQNLVAKTEESLRYQTDLVKQSEANLESAKEQFKIALNAAGFENYQQFKEAIRSEKEQQQLQQQYMNFTTELHSLTSQITEEAELLKGKEKVDLTEAERKLEELKVSYEEAQKTLNLTETYERNCIDFSEKLDRIAEEIFQLEEVSNQIVDLYNLLRGQNGKKVSFERYVQMGYLEQITEAANIRLRNLSNGQYYLQCSDRQESHGRQSGLSLDVYDSYTGQSRDVKSLSGGEKFNASLCLALGMADVIQSFQGSVRIDTMFIDEGFGSLDEESLMKAIDTLIDLQKSGRMIGVISHVAELKAAMPAILQVEKSKEGYSKTSIFVK
ncbi:AAA family ATPase [Ureibacillus composti]